MEEDDNATRIFKEFVDNEFGVFLRMSRKELMVYTSKQVGEFAILYFIIFYIISPIQSLNIVRTPAYINWTGIYWFENEGFSLKYVYNHSSGSCTVIIRYGQSEYVYNNVFNYPPTEPYNTIINKTFPITLCRF